MADKDPPSPMLKGNLIKYEIAGQARNDGLYIIEITNTNTKCV